MVWEVVYVVGGSSVRFAVVYFVGFWGGVWIRLVVIYLELVRFFRSD